MRLQAILFAVIFATPALAAEPLAICRSALHTVTIFAAESAERPFTLVLEGSDTAFTAKLTQRPGNTRLAATSLADKLFLAVHLRADGSSEILHYPMGGDAVLEPATCEGRAAVLARAGAQS